MRTQRRTMRMTNTLKSMREDERRNSEKKKFNNIFDNKRKFYELIELIA